VELFPAPLFEDCSIPDLPHPRYGHSLSLLSGGRVVVCGGYYGNFLDSCLSWVAGNSSWTPFYTMRCCTKEFQNDKKESQFEAIPPYSLDTTISS